MIADDVVQNQILPDLRTIVGLSVLDGFLIHYAKDLLSGKNGLSFPCVAVQPSGETVTPKNDLTSGRVDRSFSVVGAVSTSDASTVRSQLDKLAQDVRKALAKDKMDKTVRPITFSTCVYDLPDSKDAYAFFEMKVEFNINETWIE